MFKRRGKRSDSPSGSDRVGSSFKNLRDRLSGKKGETAKETSTTPSSAVTVPATSTSQPTSQPPAKPVDLHRKQTDEARPIGGPKGIPAQPAPEPPGGLATTGELVAEPADSADSPKPPSEPKISLWDKAYDALKAEDSQHIVDYEDLLSRVLVSGQYISTRYMNWVLTRTGDDSLPLLPPSRYTCK